MAFPWMAIPVALSAAQGIAGLFGAGGSSAEGGGAKKAKHHQLDYDRRRVLAVVNGAKDAGIHPLAALGATSGGGGFAAPVNPGSSGFGVGDAIGQGLDTFSELYQSDQDRLERAEDRAYNESMRRRQNAIDTLRSKEVTPEVRLARENAALQNDLLRMDIATSRTRLAALRAAALGGTGPGGHTFTAPGGEVFNTAPTTDSQDIENRYGDVAQEVWGIGNIVRDAHDMMYRNRVIDPEDWEKGLSQIPKAGSMKPLMPGWQ